MRPLGYVACPSCGYPAEIVRCIDLYSTDGDVPHVQVDCVTGRHNYTMPASMLPPTSKAPDDTG